jgi:hypothetical protein
MLTLNRGITHLKYSSCSQLASAQFVLAMPWNQRSDPHRRSSGLQSHHQDPQVSHSPPLLSLPCRSLGGNYIAPEGVRRLETALGLTEKLANDRPISSWLGSAPLDFDFKDPSRPNMASLKTSAELEAERLEQEALKAKAKQGEESDTGFIHVEPMRTRSSRDMVLAMESGVNFFRNCGITHEAIRTDNETSSNLKETLRKLNLRPEYVAPNKHRQNPAERDIRTFKNHFIATICTLPIAEMTLNLLRPSLRDPKQSAWSDLKGSSDFNRNPIAPAGTKVTIHEDASIRSTWDPHGVRG